MDTSLQLIYNLALQTSFYFVEIRSWHYSFRYFFSSQPTSNDFFNTVPDIWNRNRIVSASKCILHPTVSKCSSSKFLDEPTSFPLSLSTSVGSQSRIDRCCRACLERTGLASSTARGGQGKILSSRVSFFLFLFLSFFIQNRIKSGRSKFGVNHGFNWILVRYTREAGYNGKGAKGRGRDGKWRTFLGE